MNFLSSWKIILVLGTVSCGILAQRTKIISDEIETQQDFDLYQESQQTLEQRCAALYSKQDQNDDSSSEVTTTINPLPTTSEVTTTINPLPTTLEVTTTINPLPTTLEVTTTINPLPTTLDVTTTINPLPTTLDVTTTINPLPTALDVTTTINPLTTTLLPFETTTKYQSTSHENELSTDASVNSITETLDTETSSTTFEAIPFETTTTIPEPDMTNDELSATDFVIEPVVIPSSSRRGKQLDIPEPNLINQLSTTSTDALIKLIMDLTKKIENLEGIQRALHENIEDLHKKIENSPQFKEKKEETTTDLVFGDPDNAAEKWKQLSENIDSTKELQNVTSGIVEEAFDKGAPPTTVMDFVTKLPNPEVQEAAFSTIADKVNGSDKIQEELYWRDVTPYCDQAVANLGPKNPSTIKMYYMQNQIRLNGARPIAQSSLNIQHQEYMPAVTNWLTMVRDIPDSPPHLENNMKRMMIRTYEGNPINLPFAFHFILILPHTQGYYKQVAYKCLTQEMKTNGHYYNPNNHYQPGNAPLQLQQ